MFWKFNQKELAHLYRYSNTYTYTYVVCLMKVFFSDQMSVRNCDCHWTGSGTRGPGHIETVVCVHPGHSVNARLSDIREKNTYASDRAKIVQMGTDVFSDELLQLKNERLVKRFLYMCSLMRVVLFVVTYLTYLNYYL